MLSSLLARRLWQVTCQQACRGHKRWEAPVSMELRRRQIKAGPQPVERRSAYLEWNYDAELYAFGARFGENFEEGLLRTALTHQSHLHMQQQQNKDEFVTEDTKDNRELIAEGEEFIYKYLSDKFKTKYVPDIIDTARSYLTSESVLAHVGKHMGLKDLILSQDYPPEDTTLADTFKALIAALLHSSGEKAAGKFVDDLLVVQLIDKDVYEMWDPQDPYGYLERLANGQGLLELEPRLCNQSATNTILATYQVGIYSSKKLLGIGWGETVDTAKHTAAIDAIKKLHQCNNK